MLKIMRKLCCTQSVLPKDHTASLLCCSYTPLMQYGHSVNQILSSLIPLKWVWNVGALWPLLSTAIGSNPSHHEGRGLWAKFARKGRRGVGWRERRQPPPLCWPSEASFEERGWQLPLSSGDSPVRSHCLVYQLIVDVFIGAAGPSVCVFLWARPGVFHLVDWTSDCCYF